MGALERLDESLDGVLRVVDHARSLLDPPAGIESHSTPTELRQLANLVLQGSIVLLTGYLEGFLRASVEEFIDALNASSVPLGRLPDSTLASVVVHRFGLAKAESVRVAGARSFLDPSFVGTFDVKAFPGPAGNPSADVIDSVFASLGVSEVIEALSLQDYSASTYRTESQMGSDFESKIRECLIGLSSNERDIALLEIRRIIDSKWTPRKKRRVVGYFGAVSELLKLRNRIAHGEGNEIPTPDDVVAHVVMLRKLSSGLDAAQRRQVAEITRASPP